MVEPRCILLPQKGIWSVSSFYWKSQKFILILRIGKIRTNTELLFLFTNNFFNDNILIYNAILTFRWNNTPLSEAIRFRRPRLAQYLKEFIKNNPDQGMMDEYEPEENDYN